MNKKLLLVYTIIMTAIAVRAEAIVSSGVPTDEAFADFSVWNVHGGELVGRRGGDMLYSRFLYPADLTVEAELALDKLAGTAASLSVQGVNWGFDGGRNRQPFVESVLMAKDLGFSGITLVPGRFFKVRVESRNGRQRCFIDGKLLAEDIPVPQQSRENGAVYLRPHRSTMRVRKFEATGTAAGVLPKSLETPIRSGTFALGGDFEWSIPRGGLAEGEKLDLTITAGKQTVKCQAAAASPDRVTVPADALKEAYTIAGGKYNARRLELRLAGKDAKLFLVVTDPAAKGDFLRGALVKHGDRIRISYDGEAEGTIVGYEGQHGDVTAFDDARNFENIGIHDAIVLLNPFFEIDADGNFDAAAFLAKFDAIAAKLIACDPRVRFKLYISTYMSPDWCRKHPEELIVLDNGVDTLRNSPEHVRQPSLGSEVWKKRMGEIMYRCIADLRRSPFADRIGYCRVRGGNSGEWNHYGYHEKAFVDMSEPMRRAFSKWLKRRYETAENLQKAWERPGIDFDSPELLPTREARLAGGPVYRDEGGTGRRCADYYEFFQELTAQTIIGFASQVKRASGNRLLTAAYYGYYFGHYGSTPYHFQDSGHYGVRHILNSPDIDICGGPYIYPLRRFVNDVNGITGSYPLHGKLWESEEDLRTSRSGPAEKPYGAHEDQMESVALLKRDYMINLSRKSAMYFYDFAKDWYSDPEFVKTVKRLLAIDAAFFAFPPRSAPEVGVIFDEAVIPRLTNRNPSDLRERRNKWRCISLWSVASGFYYKTDLARLDPKKTPILVFAEELPSATEQEKLKARGFQKILPLRLEAKNMRTSFFAARNLIHVYGSGHHGLADTFVAPPLLGVFTRGGGRRKVWLPEKTELVVDLFSGETWQDVKEFEYPVKRNPDARIFFCGTREEYRKFQAVMDGGSAEKLASP
jgi:hypothetical protein